jgi:endonuclease YncB( thermonuclease family)
LLLAKAFIAVFACGLAVWLVAGTFSEVHHGIALVYDGDTLEIDGEAIDLQGVDAPEFEQPCKRSEKAWNCGAFSMAALLTTVYKKHVWCFEKGRNADSTIVAKCYVGMTDLASKQVESGWALALEDSARRYADEQVDAQGARRGIWTSVFDAPARWRQVQPSRAAAR